tara:strand:+ start:47 stop:724 length:678 start_codon:yes stop_codon:yes gene_type:complete
MNLEVNEFISYENKYALEEAAVKIIIECAKKSITIYGNFSIVLAGGSTPKGVYSLLSKQNCDWRNWFIYYSDERCVAIDSQDRNNLMAESVWLNSVDVPKSNIFTIPAELGPTNGAANYEELLSKKKPFDLVLLGLGDDGHIASLFPGANHDDTKQAVPVNEAPKKPTDRVSLTLSRLNNSNKVMFLVVGKNKFTALEDMKLGRNEIINKLKPKEKIITLYSEVN